MHKSSRASRATLRRFHIREECYGGGRQYQIGFVHIVGERRAGSFSEGSDRCIYDLQITSKIVHNSKMEETRKHLINQNITKLHESLRECERIFGTPLPLSYIKMTGVSNRLAFNFTNGLWNKQWYWENRLWHQYGSLDVSRWTWYIHIRQHQRSGNNTQCLFQVTG